MGDRQAIAEELSIHPQTVRYRMAQLKELYGDRLDDPRSRARLFLALEWPLP
jgi:DNA-binding PucR family transcriptional regulator